MIDDDFLNCLDRCLEKALDISDNVLVIGDVNFNMMYDNGLTFLCNSFSLTNLIKEPTCFKGSPSLLDVIMVCNPKRFKNTVNISCPVSDHHNLICTVTKLKLSPFAPKIVYYRSLKNMNIYSFLHDLKCKYVTYSRI